MNNTNIFISSKGKTSISTNGIEAYTKEQLVIEIQRFITVNVQLMIDKIEAERTKVNLEINKVRLLEEKNSLVIKKEEFRAEIAVMNTVGFFNVSIRG